MNPPASRSIIDLDAVQAEVGEHCARFLTGNPEADRLADGLAVSEELAELVEALTAAGVVQRLVKHLGRIDRAILKRHHGGRPGTNWDAELRNEAGDALITLLHLAAAEGWSLADVLTERWAEVRVR